MHAFNKHSTRERLLLFKVDGRTDGPACCMDGLLLPPPDQRAAAAAAAAVAEDDDDDDDARTDFDLAHFQTRLT